MLIAIIILSVAGLADAGYLLYKHEKKSPLVCYLNGQCQQVVAGKWSKTFGLRNDVLGLMYYALILFLSCWLWLNPSSQAVMGQLLLFLTGLGFMFSLFLTYLQKFVIKTFCLYCLFSAIIATALFILSWLLS